MEMNLGEELRSNPQLESENRIEGASKNFGIKRHFVLVHGACHGAWCWFKLGTLLESAGHKVTALDLGASGINPKSLLDLRSYLDYFKPLTDFMKYNIIYEKVILVGHSLGGLAISKVMESFPEKISVAVFLSALMPGPTNHSVTVCEENMESHGLDFGDCVFGEDAIGWTFTVGPKFLSTDTYELSPPEDLYLATKLVRPIRLYNDEDLRRSIVLSKERFGSVKRVFIISDEDKMIKKDFAEWMIEKTPPDEVKIINGSDHMVMCSKPDELFCCLQEIVLSSIFWGLGDDKCFPMNKCV